ncbi:hypothetical protein D3C85_405800 [compost metagenome]
MADQAEAHPALHRARLAHIGGEPVFPARQVQVGGILPMGVDQPRTQQVARLSHRAVLLQVGRAADGKELFEKQQLAGGHGRVRGCEANGQGRFAALQVDQLLGGLQAEGDVRVAGGELIEPAHQPMTGDGGRAGDVDRPVVLAAQLVGAAGEQLEGLGDGGGKAAPVVIQADGVAGPVEQAHPQFGLQQTDLPADRPRGHRELLRGFGEVTAAGGHFESAQRNERREAHDGFALS